MSENEKQDLDDYNDEIAGRDTGRIKRFLSREARDHLEDGKDKKSIEKLSLLDILLMTDPVYAQLYSDVMEKIEEIDRAVNKALMLANQRIDDLETNLADIRERAQRLSDGTLIYKSQDGTVFSDDGILVSQQEIGDVRWKPSDPSWEERREAGEALDLAYRKKEEIEEYRDGTLQHAKDRMNDRDNPPDKEKLEELIQGLVDGQPREVRSLTEEQPSSAQSGFMKHFQSKASGQDEMPDKTEPINQPPTQETAPSSNSTVVAP